MSTKSDLERIISIGVALVLAGTLAGCGLANEPRPQASPGSLFFEIEPRDAKTPARLGWLATYRSEGRIARFSIELQPEPKGAALPAFVRCALLREGDSDGSILIQALARAMGGSPPSPGAGVSGIEVPSVILGRNLSRGSKGNQIAGLFGSEPAGTWFSTKLFFDEAEIFLNLDPAGGWGEFSLKDQEYTAAVLRALGGLFQGSPGQGMVDMDPRPDETPIVIEPSLAPLPTPDRNDERVMTLATKAGPSGEQWERTRALEALAKMGPSARAAIPTFQLALQADDPLIRTFALRGFASLRPEPQVGLEAVRPLLSDVDPVNRALAAGALADFGEPEEAVANLIPLLKNKGGDWAAAQLTRIGAYAKPAVPALTEMLENRPGPGTGYAACMALAAIGRDAAAAIPALRAATSDPDSSMSKAAIYALKMIEAR